MRTILIALLLIGISATAYAETIRWLENGRTVQWNCSGNNCIKLE
jgi:hypothetical protein